MTTHYLLRALGTRDGDAGGTVYAIRSSTEKQDPVPVLAAYPLGWRPTENPATTTASTRRRRRLYPDFLVANVYVSERQLTQEYLDQTLPAED